MQVGKVCSLAVLPLSSSIQSCRNVAQYTAELAVKKKVREQSGSLPFFKAGRIYKHRIFHTRCKSMGSPDLLGFAVPFYLVQMICALLICEAFSDMPQVNRVPMRQTHKLKNSIPLKQLNKPCIVKKKKKH